MNNLIHIDLRPAAAKRPARRLLKKELSLDTYSWQKKYAHLTSSVMMAQVDERLKRRFSVSTSMEEISKIAEMKNIGSQANINNPEQAALAQSQHFDQLEALWNKRSPPRRRMNVISLTLNQRLKVTLSPSLSLQPSLSRQSSLAEDRINSSDEDEFLEERTGTCSNYIRPSYSPPITSRACYKDTHSTHFIKHSTSSMSLENNQPDLLKEVLAQSIKSSRTENDLERLQLVAFKSKSFEVGESSSQRRKARNFFKFPSHSLNSAGDDTRMRKKSRHPLARSCISQ